MGTPQQKHAAHANSTVTHCDVQTHVAEGILQDLEKIKDWNATAADRDYAHNNVRHAFWSVRQAPVLETITRAITQVRQAELLCIQIGHDCAVQLVHSAHQNETVAS